MTLSLSLSHMAYVSYELFRLLRISTLFFKFVGKNRAKKKKIPYFGDGFRENSLIFNVQC